VLTEVAAPYRLPLFDALAERTSLEVHLLAARDPRRAYRFEPQRYRFEHRVLPGVSLHRRLHWLVLNAGVGRALSRGRPEVVIVGGWNQPAFWLALAWARRRSVPVVAWVESTLRDRRRGSAAGGRAKRWFIGRCDAFLVPGSASAAYLERLGVEADRITVAPNTVEHADFGDRVGALRRERARIRDELGVDGVTFLTVARLSPEKGLDVLLRAFAGIEATLVVVGDGPERLRLVSAASPGVRFEGHLEGERLRAWYAAADAFVVPSLSETWSIALTEAALAGLPLVATDAVGAAWDLIEDGTNGFRVPAGDADALHAALRRLAQDEDLRASARGRSLALAEPYTPDAWADAVLWCATKLARRRTVA
jgi:glycosyltransferase involved in cell wall biosynthesis